MVNTNIRARCPEKSITIFELTNVLIFFLFIKFIGVELVKF